MKVVQAHGHSPNAKHGSYSSALLWGDPAPPWACFLFCCTEGRRPGPCGCSHTRASGWLMAGLEYWAGVCLLPLELSPTRTQEHQGMMGKSPLWGPTLDSGHCLCPLSRPSPGPVVRKVAGNPINSPRSSPPPTPLCIECVCHYFPNEAAEGPREADTFADRR